MSARPDSIALEHARDTCRTHAQALGDALSDIALRGFGPGELDRLDKSDRRLLDQFAYRYTRLQDDMGARLMPAIELRQWTLPIFVAAIA